MSLPARESVDHRSSLPEAVASSAAALRWLRSAAIKSHEIGVLKIAYIGRFPTIGSFV